MKNKKNVIITIAVILCSVVIGLITYNVLVDENKLTSWEKRWINNNLNNVQNINVINNVNLFGLNGSGVFYEFLNDLELEHKLQINPVTYNYGEVVNGISLGAKTSLTNNDYVFYTDHYVLISKKEEVVKNYSDFANKKIGVLNSELAYISKFVNDYNVSLTSYTNEEELFQALKDNKDIQYIIVPLTVYIDEILKNDYYIVNHLSDVKLYYTITKSDSYKDLSSIIVKFYKKWHKDNLEQYYTREKFNLYSNSLGISETEVDAMRSVVYKYGFVNNSPYEVIMSGNYGGIVAMYLNDFSKFSGVDFNFTKYRNLNKFKKALNKGEIDLYFNYYNIQDNYFKVDSKILMEYSVIANKSNDFVVNSLNSLINNTVYVEENSILNSYLKNIKGINIKTYEDESDLKKLNKKDVIIVIDKNIYNLYSSSKLANYTERYSNIIDDTYSFKSKTSSAFYKLFTKYIMSLDNQEMIYKGMYNHSLTVKTGNILGTIAKYILLILAVLSIVGFIFYKSSKKIKVAKKIKKENKLKFIDQLTSLKNRNYLSEYINNWNNNTIYPQTMVVIDLNNIQFINDTLGYEEGDKQIQAAANILIKTQLDNSDVMRTDGNEFLVYLVGYSQKQVTNYIHKLNKEFKKLPYEYGAEFGYSMINDNIKTVEDAILEATDEMKKQKKKETGE